MAEEITLVEIGETLEFIVGRMATKSDLAELRQTIATKDDVRTIVREETHDIRAELASIRRELKDLTGKVGNIIGLPKEIDHALDRIRRIERHLGIETDIAA